MKVPLSWLRKYVDVDLPIADLAHRLTMAGVETESITHVGADWEKIIIVQVVDLDRHPNADTLWLAKVDTGSGAATLVTGAPNLSVGVKVPLVMPGGKLPGGLEVTARKFRGILSEGMLCAADELGIGTDHSGIYLLEPDAPVGEEARRFLGETILDLYITPNRPDCMSILGIAREVQALTGNPLRRPDWRMPPGDQPATDLLSVEIADPDLCPRFSASVIRDIQIRPSPQWLQRRLHFAGVRPISNVVDVTNYVMLEVGQPMHAFDGGKLQGGILVRRARDGECLVTLDNQPRELRSPMMVVADQERASSLAGIMGGLDSEIGPDTRLVVLEAANWSPTNTRRTGRELGLKSEASRRFERGVDPGLTVPAIARGTQLLVDLADGRSADGIVDVYPRPEQPRQLTLRLSDVAGLLGKTYTHDEVATVLRNLDFTVQPAADDALAVTVPGHRRDVERKADLIEEVARITGYDAIPEVIFQGRVPEPKPDPAHQLEHRAKLTLAAAGCQEVITYSLVHPTQPQKLDLTTPWPPGERESADLPPTANSRQPTAIAVHNPMSLEQSVLRPTLLGSLLETLWSNLRHRDRVWCFELAHVYLPPMGPLPREPRRLAIALSGPREPETWLGPTQPTDFFDLKGILELLLDRLGVHAATFRPAEHPSLQPGRAAEILVGPPGDPHSLGQFGQLHPRIAERFDLDGRAVMLAELDFDALSAVASDALTSTVLPDYPALKLDLSLIVEDAITHQQLVEALRQPAGDLLEDAVLFDLYRGPQVPEGHKSLAYQLTFRAPDRTLTDADIVPLIEAIEFHLAQRLRARVRRV